MVGDDGFLRECLQIVITKKHSHLRLVHTEIMWTLIPYRDHSCWVTVKIPKMVKTPSLIFKQFYRPQRKVLFSQACVSHSVHNRPRSYSLRRGRYASYWNAFLFLCCFLWPIPSLVWLVRWVNLPCTCRFRNRSRFMWTSPFGYQTDVWPSDLSEHPRHGLW